MKESRPPRARIKVISTKSDVLFDFTQVNDLRRYLTSTGRIRPRKVTGLSAKSQRSLSLAVKRARYMALLPYLVRTRVSFN